MHSAIRGYRANFLAVMKAIEQGWIPEGVEPGLTEHLDALRDHLAATGVPENDTFLLRYALTVPGMQRGIVPPLLVLEPNRSGFSERRKREAAGQVNRLGEALSLARAFLTGLSRETSQALENLTPSPPLGPKTAHPLCSTRFVACRTTRRASLRPSRSIAWRTRRPPCAIWARISSTASRASGSSRLAPRFVAPCERGRLSGPRASIVTRGTTRPRRY